MAEEEEETSWDQSLEEWLISEVLVMNLDFPYFP